MTADRSCFNRLSEQFQYLFEKSLIEELCARGFIRSYDEDEVLIDHGDVISHMPLVLSGSIKVMTEDQDGEALLLYYLEWGETCAVTLNCCTKKKKATVRAITETTSEILFIPVDCMEEWMVKYASWRGFVLNSFNERLSEMLGAIDNLVFQRMDERLRQYLKDRAWANKSEVLSTSHANIAHDLHTSRVVVSRLMKQLEKEGFIRQRRNQIVVLDFEK